MRPLVRLFIAVLLLVAAYVVLRPTPPLGPMPEPAAVPEPAVTPRPTDTPRPADAPPTETSPAPAEPAEPPTDALPSGDSAKFRIADSRVANVTVRDRGGRVMFSGTVDLAPTLARIERGEALRFPDDGIVFRNREHRLPARPSGYYHEYVHPTPHLDGPGPQRVVVGAGGEVYYTPDHYRTFQRL